MAQFEPKSLALIEPNQTSLNHIKSRVYATVFSAYFTQGIYKNTALRYFKKKLEKGEIVKTTSRTDHKKDGNCLKKINGLVPVLMT